MIKKQNKKNGYTENDRHVNVVPFFLLTSYDKHDFSTLLKRWNLQSKQDNKIKYPKKK